MKRRLIKLLTTILIGIVVLAIGIGLYLQQPKFGSLPNGERLGKIESSPNYIDGNFENLIPTPQLIEGTNVVSATLKYLFNKKERPAPINDVPSVKTDFLNLDKNKDMIIWLGHSSYFMRLTGKNILIDPVFSPSAAPVSFANKAFKGTNPYTAEDMPKIDYLLITHDHWDHLDYPTIVALKPKIKNVICGLGVGVYFEQWGFAKSKIHEADWFATLEMDNDFTIHVLPARYFSGRMLTRNKTLWNGFALITPKRNF